MSDCHTLKAHRFAVCDEVEDDGDGDGEDAGDDGDDDDAAAINLIHSSTR